MQTVYIVVDSWDVNTTPELYVFSTEDKAKDKMDKLVQLGKYAGCLSIVEETIDYQE